MSVDNEEKKFVLEKTKSKKKKKGYSSVERKDSGEAFNASFMTHRNMIWYNHVILEWLPDPNKPLVFLPCGMAESTRNSCIVLDHQKIRKKVDKKHVILDIKEDVGFWGYQPLKRELTGNETFDSRKFISKGTGHDFLSVITRNEKLERVILSEPLTIIPYSLEGHPLRPDYNLPVEELSIQSEQIFIRQLAMVLLLIKAEQPNRKNVYYVGPKHHYFILKYANLKAHKPFKVVHSVNKNGRVGLSGAAKKLEELIINYEQGIEEELEEPDLEDFIVARNTYTSKKFWTHIVTRQRLDSGEYQKKPINVMTKKEAEIGFKTLYEDKKIKVEV